MQEKPAVHYFSRFDLGGNKNKIISFFQNNQMSKTAEKIGKVQIHQRRYLGCKTAVLDLIEKVIKERIGAYGSLIDIFAGTGVVGYYFNNPAIKIISNDILVSNYISLSAWLSFQKYDNNKVVEIIEELNQMKPQDENYVSEHFGNKYFSKENARKIGAIRQRVEKYALSKNEKAVLLTSLMYAMDRVANTCGHYDAYRQEMDSVAPIKLLLPDIKLEMNVGNEVYNEDGNVLIKRIHGDILYIDPPYNSRQYCDTYHVLDNIIMWAQPPVFGKARKYDRSAFKSKYNTKEALRAFAELIKFANVHHVLFSYNNMQTKGNTRSNAILSDNDITAILQTRGTVEIFEKEYNQFSAGKSNINGHTERVFWCEVTK